MESQGSNPDSSWILSLAKPCSSFCVCPVDINGCAECCQRGRYWLSCMAFVCINTRLFRSLNALCKNESRESTHDWWALRVDRALLSSLHHSFRQGFLFALLASETKEAMFLQMGCLGLVFLTSLLLQFWPITAFVLAAGQILVCTNCNLMGCVIELRLCTEMTNGAWGDFLLGCVIIMQPVPLDSCLIFDTCTFVLFSTKVRTENEVILDCWWFSDHSKLPSM